tara:strand:+ start:8465 stop:9694 length:1230 start_codon:yes stop_codon:yes gene_type:complete
MTEALKQLLDNFETSFNDKRGTRFVEFVGAKNESLSKALNYLHASDLLSEIKRLNRDGKLDFYFDDEHIHITPFNFNENNFFNYNNKQMKFKNRRNRKVSKRVNEAISPYDIVKNIIDIYHSDDQMDLIESSLSVEGQKIYALMEAQELAEYMLFLIDGDSLIGIYSIEDVMDIKLEKNFSEKDAQELSRLELVELMFELDDAKVLPPNLLDEVEQYGDYSLEYEGQDWRIFTSHDEAEEAAKEEIQNLIDDIGLESINIEFGDYLQKHALRDFWQADAEDQVGEYLDDAKVEYLEDNYSDYEDALEEDEDLTEDEWVEDTFNDDEWSESWVNERVEELVLGGITEFTDLGYEGSSLLKVLKDNDIIDIDAMIEDVVSIDGLGHTLSGYDGEEVEVRIGRDEFYCFRHN